MDEIAHQPGLDGRAFHLCNPKPQRSGDVMNAFAAAAHAPQLTVRIDTKLLKALPKIGQRSAPAAPAAPAASAARAASDDSERNLLDFLLGP